jgi:hypothetical protein
MTKASPGLHRGEHAAILLSLDQRAAAAILSSIVSVTSVSVFHILIARGDRDLTEWQAGSESSNSDGVISSV